MYRSLFVANDAKFDTTACRATQNTNQIPRRIKLSEMGARQFLTSYDRLSL
jgi:hypothetical protein